MTKTNESVMEGKSKLTANGNDPSESIKHRSTGPRTPAGKQRSSRNAERHGFSSKRVSLDSVLRKQLQVFLNDLGERFQPVGETEGALVQTLALLLLRQERLHIAEGAQGQLDANYLEWDQGFKDVQELGQAGRVEYKGESSEGFCAGLFYRTENPKIRDACIGLLTELINELSKAGFDLDLSSRLLASIYGGYSSGNVSYLKELRQGGNTKPPRKEALLEEISTTRAQLLSEGERQKKIEAGRVELTRWSHLVPDSPNLERFIRYETQASREFDRTLNRLERLQRMRLGQPPPPTLNVNVS